MTSPTRRTLPTLPKPSPDYCCSICSEIFVNQEVLDIHKSGHANNMKCPICNMVLKSLKNYEKHCLRCKPYECQICGRVVRFRPNFIKHMRVHTGEESVRLKYKCDVCKKEFMSFEYFKVHKKIHSENLNLTCTVCGKVFSAMASLRGHMKLHTGDQLHVCDVCGKGFGQRYNLKIHSRVHTGLLPFECSMCDKKFHTESSYESHLKAHHPSSTDRENKLQDSLNNTQELKANQQMEENSNVIDSNNILVKEEPLDSLPPNLFQNVPEKSRMKTISDFLAGSSDSTPLDGIEDNFTESSDLSYSNIFDFDSVSQSFPFHDSYLDERDVPFRSESRWTDLQCTTTTDGNFIRKEWVYTNYGVAGKFDDDEFCRAASFIYD